MMVQKDRFENALYYCVSSYLKDELKEVKALIKEIESYVMEFVHEYGMHYDSEWNLFVEGRK